VGSADTGHNSLQRSLSSEVGSYTSTNKKSGAGKMKFQYYVIYGMAKNLLASPEETKKMWNDFAKVLKKHKMELVFWGSPWGTTENSIYVMKGNIEDYQTLPDDPDYFKVSPIDATATRTNIVMVP